MSRAALTRATASSAGVVLEWSRALPGAPSVVPWVALHAGDPRGENASRQRRAEWWRAPSSPELAARVAGVRVLASGDLEVAWASSSAAPSRYDAAWLARAGAELEPAALRAAAPKWWGGDGLDAPADVVEEATVRCGERGDAFDFDLESALRAWAVRGFAVVRGGPSAPGAVRALAAALGTAPKPTNYGEVYDVRDSAAAAAGNLADTAEALAPHTDNPYREPVPAVQLLHCVRPDAGGAGGLSTLVDGVAAAERLRAVDPGAFATLARVRTPFVYEDAAAGVRLFHERRVIELDDAGRAVRAVAWNPRSAKIPRAGTDLERYFAACRRFGEILNDGARAARLRLEAGDALVMDNTRALHGRTAYQPSGVRHLQGCYVDPDALRSRLAVIGKS